MPAPESDELAAQSADAALTLPARYYAQSQSIAPEQRAHDLRFSDEVQREDSAICEAVQRGLASGSCVAGRLHPERASALLHFHELLRAAYRDHRAAAGAVSA